MRIIGGHDYFDGAGMGVDRSILFRRHAKPDAVPCDVSLPEPICWSDRAQHRIEFMIFLVGGECIPACLVTSDPKPVYFRPAEPSAVRIFGTFDEAWPDVERAPAPFSFLEKSHRNKRKETVLGHFSPPRNALQTFCLDREIVTGIIRSVRWGERSDSGVVIEENTDQLGANHLMRLLDPATAHMRIASFIGGVMPQRRDVLELSDKDKIRKAGFDQASFRDWKGKKKPRGSRAA